jgi:hypothetical protein
MVGASEGAHAPGPSCLKTVIYMFVCTCHGLCCSSSALAYGWATAVWRWP